MYYKYNPPFIPDTSNREFPAVFLKQLFTKPYTDAGTHDRNDHVAEPSVCRYSQSVKYQSSYKSAQNTKNNVFEKSCRFSHDTVGYKARDSAKYKSH